MRTKIVVLILSSVLLGGTVWVAPSAVSAADPQPSAEAAATPPATDPPASSPPLGPGEDPFPLPTGEPIDPPDPAVDEEIVELRTDTSRTWEVDGGQFIAELNSTPIFYRPEGDGALEPINLTFRGDGDDAVVDRSPVSVRVGASEASQAVVILTGPDGFSIGYTPLIGGIEAGLPSPAPARRESVADLSSVLPGVDLRVSARADGANLFLILSEEPALTAWTFAVSVPSGTKLVADDGGAVQVIQGGTVRARIAAPYAVDSTSNPERGSGNETTALHYDLGTAVDGRPTITVRFDDASWLAKAVYPVYIDPSTTLVGPGSNTHGDAHINEGNPTQNYANYQRPDSPFFYEMWLGTDPSNGTYKNHALIKFDLANVAGRVIESAELQLRPYHAYYDAPTERNIWVRRIYITSPDTGWTESDVTWNTRPDKTTGSYVIESCAESAVLSCFADVTYWVQTWVDGLNANWGFWVDTNGNNNTYWKRLISAEQAHSTSPRLYVAFHDPVSLVYPITGGTSSRTLSWSTDTAWGQTHYEVDVSTDPGFGAGTFVAQSGQLTGSNSSWLIPSSGVLNLGTTYHWRVRAKATNGSWSVWTAGSFVHDLAPLGLEGHHRYESWDLGAGDGLSVDVSTGNLVLSHPMVSLPYRGGNLPIDLSYNSQDPADVGLGTGWRLSVQRRLTIHGSGTVSYVDADGSQHKFTNPVTVGSVTTYTRPQTLYATLVKDTSQAHEFTLTFRDYSVETFDLVGTNDARIMKASDRFANDLVFAYSTGFNLSSISDPAGRTVDFTWDTAPTPDRLSSFTDWAYVSGGIVQTTNTGSRRLYRFQYSGSSLVGWADPVNTSGTCGTPPYPSHLTCLAYSGGLLIKVNKLLTKSILSGSTISTSTATATTEVLYRGNEVRQVEDALQSGGSTGTTLDRVASGKLKVVRLGTPNSETTYGFVSATDTLARVASVWRKLGAGQIEQRTAWDSTYPIEPASVTDNYVDGVVGNGSAPTVEDHKVFYTYIASTLGLLSRLTEPLDGTNNRTTDYVYNAHNDVTQLTVALNAGSTNTITRYCHSSTSCGTADNDFRVFKVIENYKDGTAGGTNGQVEDVSVSYLYDANGQRTRATRSNYSGSTLLDSAATGSTYDANGNVTADIANYASGTVTSPGDDIDPNSSTNARTDLTTAYGYDTAGNIVSIADPRRAIEQAKGTSLAADDYTVRTQFDSLNQAVVAQLPTTPGAGDCTPPGATCRQESSTYDEYGNVRSNTDYGNRVFAASFDLLGQATETYEDDDTSPGGARLTGKSSYDAAGRLTWVEDAIQANDPAGGTDPGRTQLTYDDLGRPTSKVDAYGSASPTIASTTAMTYDALDRILTRDVGTESGAAQRTINRYDLGGRVTELDDEFTCTSTTYDYRDLASASVEGKTPGAPCAGSGSRTVNDTYDGLARRTSSVVANGPTLEAATYDSAGNQLASSSLVGTLTEATELTVNPLDQVAREYRYRQVGTDPVTSQVWIRQNYDAAGNQTDRCAWASAPLENCKRADQSFAAPQPVAVSTSGYDARDNRISLYLPGVGETTYDPAAGYQVKGVFIPTAGGKEHQTIYAYDVRDRLDTITNLLCSTNQRPQCTGGNILSTTLADDYDYDDNDNRIKVAENNGSASSTRHYCYDARNQLGAVHSAAGCSTGLLETFAYDAAGNRTSAPGSPQRTFTYDGQGRITGCTSPSCSVSHDADGRISQVTDSGLTWTYVYDGEGRLAIACKATSCSGSGFDRLDFAYNGLGHRTQIKETTSGGTVTTTDFRYDGDTVVQEYLSSGITRTFTIDEGGSIVKVGIAGDATSNNGTYLVSWNGHGDAIALLKVDGATGALTLANTFTYGTWGTPTVATHNGIGDLGFRYLYVGRADVQWDNAFGLGLLYMHARHQSPTLARFLQPDPMAAEPNRYAYGANSPITKIDPSGGCAVAAAAFGPLGWLVTVATCIPTVVAAAKVIVAVAVTVAVTVAAAWAIQQNRLRGLAAQHEVARQLRRQNWIVRENVFFPVPGTGGRYLDVCAYRSWAQPLRMPTFCIEVKTGGSRYFFTDQFYKDFYIQSFYRFPIIYSHFSFPF